MRYLGEKPSTGGLLILTNVASECDKKDKKEIYNKLSYGTMIEKMIGVGGGQLVGQASDREVIANWWVLFPTQPRE